jgi:hypothetical protein
MVERMVGAPRRRARVTSVFRRCCLCAGLTGLALPAAGQDIRWWCWYERSDETARCVLDRAVLVTDRANDEAEAAEVARLEAELPANLPRFARELRLNPLRFANEEVAVPLWAPPTDPAAVEELAQAIMCGSRRACVVVMLPNRMSVPLSDILDDDPALE